MDCWNTLTWPDGPLPPFWVNSWLNGAVSAWFFQASFSKRTWHVSFGMARLEVHLINHLKQMATLQTFRDYSSSFVGKRNITVLVYFSVHWFGEIHPECWHLYIVTPPERSTASRIFLCVPKKRVVVVVRQSSVRVLKMRLRQGSWNDFIYRFRANSWLVWNMEIVYFDYVILLY